MNKYALYLASIITMTCISFAHAKDQDPLFIKQDKYDSWILSEYYNAVSLTNIQGSAPVTIQLKPYGYSLAVEITFDQKQKNFPATIEIDIGDNFTSELKRVSQTNTYTVTLEPINALNLFNSVKNNKNIVIYVDNDTINIPLNGINKAMDTMDIFAKDHYISLPQPFSSKIDIYATMSIPDVIPYNLYPIFRQQSYFYDVCNSKDKDQKDNKQEACKRVEQLRDLLKQQGFCVKENIQLAQSFAQDSKISYQWTECSQDTK